MAAFDVISNKLRLLQPGTKLVDRSSLLERAQSQLAPQRLLAWLIFSLSLSAVLLAISSVYALLSFLSAHRQRELAVRAALGASLYHLRRLVFSHAFAGILGGVIVAAPLAWFTGKLIEEQMPGVVSSPSIFLAAALTIIIVALSATWFPSRAAAKCDLMAVLRHD